MTCQRVLALFILVAVAMPCGSADARSKKKPPDLQMVVKEGKKVLGTEVLRSKSGEANRYFSTQTKMRQNGRSFTHRTHTILDDKGAVLS